jgi:hypothetical protein
MKKYTTTLIASLCFTFLLSCSEETVDATISIPSTSETISPPTKNVFKKEDPLVDYLAITGYNQFVLPCGNINDSFEIGFIFYPLTNGSINALSLRIPKAKAKVVMTIWDVASKAKIRTEEIEVLTANTIISKDITSLDLVKNKKYAVTVYTNSYYMRHAAEWAQPQYPVTCGNIKIVAALMGFANSNLYPETSTGNFQNGDCTFNFMPTN